MMKLLGFFVGLGLVMGVSASPTHVGPDGTEDFEDLPDPQGISLPEVQVVRFLGQHFPEMLGELEKAEAVGPEKREEVLNRARGIILEWEEHFRVGEQVAENFIAVERLHYENDRIVAKYVKMEEGTEKVETGEKLRANLGKVHQLRMELERAELDRLKEEIVAIEENLKYSGENRETMVETELRDLLEYWRLDQAGATVGRDREEPLIPAELVGEGTVPGTGLPMPTGLEPKKADGRVEVARPVEEGSGGGFIERGGDASEVVKPAETVEEEKEAGDE